MLEQIRSMLLSSTGFLRLQAKKGPSIGRFATSPFRNTEGCHSEEVMVFEATYLVAVLTLGQMSPCCGQNAAQISKVLRPNNRSMGISNIFFTAAPIASSSKGAAHPP